MNIQTAGQQKYYNFIEERAKKLRTGMIVWGSLLAVAFIGMFSDIRVALVLALSGAALAAVNLKSQRALKEKLDAVDDKEEFFLQLTDADVVECPEHHLMVTKEYALVMKKDVFIYPLSKMEKVEAEPQGKAGKVLFLTDKEGVRHEIISCMKGSGEQETFDKIYQVLRERI